ncbi:MAG: sulfatase-like hydrolase/transferase [Isosphaeraceae bacterium]|nr:sulfatase-like hydrolase/transferase [Isosphaeraceae bacterium]
MRQFSLMTAFVITVGATAAGAEPARSPNVVFILADDLGWGDLGCYGNRALPTPNLDRLAAEGTLFTHFYVGGSVCSPSRSAFLTARYPAVNRIHGHFATDDLNRGRGMPDSLDPAIPTLAAALRDVGYKTAHIGKWHLGHSASSPAPTAYGFDFVRACTSSNDTWKETNDDPYFRAKSSALFVDEGLRFIEANCDKPFYLQLWMLVPHATLNPTPEQLKQFRSLDPGVQAGGRNSARSIYYASVADLDRQVGRLLRGLEDLGVAKDTLVIFSSDNGPEEIFIRNAGHSGVGSPGPFRGRKRSLYEGGIRVPFLLRLPGRVPAGRVEDRAIVSGVDLFPSIAALTGAKVPDASRIDGEDRSAVWLGASMQRKRPLFWEWRFNIAGHVSNISPILAVRDDRWKLLLNPDGSRAELYDIPADPGETKDRAEAHPDIVERLRKQAIEWQRTLPAGPFDKNAGSNAYPWPKQRKAG